MKRILCLVLCIAMMLGAMALVGCNNTNDDSTGDSKVKLGFGVYVSTPTVTNATADVNGAGKAAVTAAAVLIGDDGKIIKCVVDTAENTASYTFEGKAVANESFKTKYELGTDYGMSAYGQSQDKNGDGIVKEWFEQVDAFCATVRGKTITEVKALMAADGYYGGEELVNAGCTMGVADFVKAVEKAVANAKASDATANSELKLGMATEQSTKDANADADGYNQFETTAVAAAINADGKIIAQNSECVQIKYTFNVSGESTFDTTKEIKGKGELGAAYNMATYGQSQDVNGDGVVKEWFEQAAAFDAACIGKTAGEIESLLGENGYGVSELQNAGCTVKVTGFVKAAAKLG